MNAEGGGVALSSADRNLPIADVEGLLPQEDDDNADGSVVVWNGMVARIPAPDQPAPAND